jgi:ABC-type cobalt transport system substrate-binding protein
MAFFPIRPFWNDEWRLMYNIKFKTIPQLWGRLDLLQECPRVYLSILKIISARFDYSYLSFRLPPLLIGMGSAFFVFALMKRFFNSQSLYRFLFVLILISSQTFTDYLTQVKQYEMDIFLSLLTLWQLDVMMGMGNNEPVSKANQAVLYGSFLLVPFLSYVYPITVVPLCALVFFQWWKKGFYFNQHTVKIILPMIMVVCSILIFYWVDVRHLMADKSMYLSYKKAYYKGGDETFIEDIWNVFALVGSGFLFEIIFGIIGIVAFVYGIACLVGSRFLLKKKVDFLRAYAIALLLLVMLLIGTGKIIGGVARLTAYTVPSISFLIIFLLEDLKQQYRKPKLANIIAGILFLGLIGNIITTCINSFTYEDYHNRMTTYWNTSKALKESRLHKIPLLISDGVCGDPYIVPAIAPAKIESNTINQKQIQGADTLCAEAITKVNPEYKIWDTIPIYYMPDSKWLNAYFLQTPSSVKEAIVGDGIHFFHLKK